ncbi:MAG: CBS domain-containing protein [Spirochaetia bacterium]|jgi:signal-transduction protein with cAMP-binding, CBS, and nucleotidyltransferase domain
MMRNIRLLKASTHVLILARPGETLGEIHGRLCDNNAVVIVDADGRLKGIVTRLNAVKAILERPDWKDIPVQELMVKDVLHVPNHVTLAEAAEVMLRADIHQLVITGPPEGGSVAIGIVTLQDVLKNAV